MHQDTFGQNFHFDWGQKISPGLGQHYKDEAEANISASRPSCGQTCSLEAETKAKTVASSLGKIKMLILMPRPET